MLRTHKAQNHNRLIRSESNFHRDWKLQPIVNARLPSGGWCAMTLAKIFSCESASLAYGASEPMIFYETDVFTARIVELIDDESYSTLQAVLIADPEAGDLIPKTRGLRKIRWMGSGRGKRGGIRVIYYLVCQDEIYMLYAYPKNQESDLSPRHYQMLRELVEQHLEP